MSLIADIIAQDPVAMKQLRAARALGLPDWCIAAGFVRNRVWDHFHGIVPPRAPADIDVIYYDAGDLSKESEQAHEEALDRLLPGLSLLSGPYAPAAARAHQRVLVRGPVVAGLMAVVATMAVGLITQPRQAEDIVAAGYERATVEFVTRLVDRAEWKRRQGAIGPKISGMAFGRDRRVPITSRPAG